MLSGQFNKTCHKWLSLIVGIQLLLWLGSGLYLNLMDHQKASGNGQRQRVVQQTDFSSLSLMPVKSLQQGTVESVRLISILDQAVYAVYLDKPSHSYQKQSIVLLDAVTGKPYQIQAPQARRIAALSYKGDADIVSSQLLSPPIEDLPSERNDTWQVVFKDDAQTKVYISNTTGRVLAHVNDDRRIKDLMMKLHFMDYGNVGGFDNWQVLFFAIAALLLSLTGGIWVIRLLKDRQYGFAWSKQRRNITVNFADTAGSSHYRLKSGPSLLESLGDESIHLPSSCGGGGTCGKCRFRTNETLSITSAERELLSRQQLEDGIRLACQHRVGEVASIELEQQLDVHQLALVVTRTRFVTPFIKEITFKPVNGEKLSYKAGAFMRFHIPAGLTASTPNDIEVDHQPFWATQVRQEYQHTGATRHYSLADHDALSDELTFNVRWQTAPQTNMPPGTGSSYLCNLTEGETVNVTGPFEEFYAPPDSTNRKVFIGAGSGMAPLKAIIFEHFDKYQKRTDVTYIFGARTERDLLYLDAFKQLEASQNSFTFIPVLSKPTAQWQGHKGYVQQYLEDFLKQQTRHDDIEFYLCGPKAMMEDVLALLDSFDIARQRILKDDFSR